MLYVLIGMRPLGVHLAILDGSLTISNYLPSKAEVGKDGDACTEEQQEKQQTKLGCACENLQEYGLEHSHVTALGSLNPFGEGQAQQIAQAGPSS